MYCTLFFTLMIYLLPLTAKEDYRIEFQPTAIEVCSKISSTGTLKQKENGFIYLDTSNDFITEVVSQLDLPGTLNKRPTAARSIGAHISVFHESEAITPEELGKEFTFSVKDIRSFTLHTRDGLKKLWVIAVDSPELEALREKYGLESKLKGYDFHITLGKQMPVAQDNWQNETELSAFNFSDEPTLGIYDVGDFETVENSAVIETASKIDQVAQLSFKSNGFCYLNVSNDFVDKISEQIPVSHRFDPINTSKKQLGAHMSVLYEDEVIGKELWVVPEIGKWFSFEVKELRYVDKGAKRIWLLACDAPSLERYRKSLGLRPKLQNHDFHITLGYEYLDEMQVDAA